MDDGRDDEDDCDGGGGRSILNPFPEGMMEYLGVGRQMGTTWFFLAFWARNFTTHLTCEYTCILYASIVIHTSHS